MIFSPLMPASWRRLLMATTVVALLLLLGVDVAEADFQPGWLVLVLLGVFAAALSLASAPLLARVGLAAVSSWLATGWLRLGGGADTWGLAEAAALLLLVVAVVRSLRLRLAVPAVIVLGGALAAAPLRLAYDGRLLFVAVMMVAFAAAAGLGSALRWSDQRRLMAVEAARIEERLDLARDLHDSVAHQVTGILVQAQAAQVVATQNPSAATQALVQIEHASTEALASMRQLVRVMRSAEAPPTSPETASDGLRHLADRFTSSGPGPSVLLDAEQNRTLDDLPAPVARAVYRLVQEALTNTARHAPDATTVRIGIHHDDHLLDVRICDDGRGHGRKPDPGSGRFGLKGVSERVNALGGRLDFGPAPDTGWQLHAVIPTTPTPAPTGAHSARRPQ